MAIYELDGQAPELPAGGNYFIADTATVIGKVRLKNSASVWFGAVLRGDNEWIEIGEGSNLQDNFREDVFRASFCAGGSPDAALLRSASLRSIGMPCFFRRSANASSANSWMVAILSRPSCLSLSKVSSSKAINLRTSGLPCERSRFQWRLVARVRRCLHQPDRRVKPAVTRSRRKISPAIARSTAAANDKGPRRIERE